LPFYTGFSWANIINGLSFVVVCSIQLNSVVYAATILINTLPSHAVVFTWLNFGAYSGLFRQFFVYCFKFSLLRELSVLVASKILNFNALNVQQYA
jgi:hypothetical protein